MFEPKQCEVMALFNTKDALSTSWFVQILWGERRGAYIHRRGSRPTDGAPDGKTEAVRGETVQAAAAQGE